jgi:aryl-alcohol dehydrogenase-like predicted oxidoreductase
VIAASELRRVIFGCGNFGGLGSSPALRGKGDDRVQALAMLGAARAAGLTRFDTANTYGGGASERVLGHWLRAQDAAWRAGIEVATKVGNPHGTPEGERPLSAAQVATHIEESLRRLGVERIDLYYLHEFDAETPLEETLRAIEAALAAGKIARFGVSNASFADLSEVLRLATGPLRKAFTNVQNGFNLLEQGDLAEVIPFCAKEGLRYVAFSPLAGGLLSGKYAAGQPAAAGTRLEAAPGLYAHLTGPDAFDAIAALRERAEAQGWPLAGAALRFVLDTPGVDSLIIAPRTSQQLAAYGLGDVAAQGADG